MTEIKTYGLKVPEKTRNGTSYVFDKMLDKKINTYAEQNGMDIKSVTPINSGLNGDSKIMVVFEGEGNE